MDKINKYVTIFTYITSVNKSDNYYWLREYLKSNFNFNVNRINLIAIANRISIAELNERISNGDYSRFNGLDIFIKFVKFHNIGDLYIANKASHNNKYGGTDHQELYVMVRNIDYTNVLSAIDYINKNNKLYD